MDNIQSRRSFVSNSCLFAADYTKTPAINFLSNSRKCSLSDANLTGQVDQQVHTCSRFPHQDKESYHKKDQLITS
jgi:hypothetical protein